MTTYRLCYVARFAYFTSKPLDKQWGDDWDDAPYNCNAGSPYSDSPDQIVKVAFDGDYTVPSETAFNCPYSVQNINQGQIPWLVFNKYDKESISIPAGTTLEDFCALVKKAGGSVYMEAK
jgi:hypothetical protein